MIHATPDYLPQITYPNMSEGNGGLRFRLNSNALSWPSALSLITQ